MILTQILKSEENEKDILATVRKRKKNCKKD